MTPSSPENKKTDSSIYIEEKKENETSSPHEKTTSKKDPKKSESITGWIVLACCVLVLCLCGYFYLQSPNRAGNEIKSRSITLTDVGFDTPVTFKTTGTEKDFNKYVDIIESTYQECNELFDAFHTYPDKVSLKEVNDTPRNTPVEVDPKVIEVLQDSLKAHGVNSKFDVSQGKLTMLWKQAFGAQTPALPDAQAIEAAKNPDSMDAVVVKDNTITLTNEAAALDFGAIAKGYTTQLAADRLTEAGLEYGFLNAGGNVILIGEKPEDEDWVVGIQNPYEPNSLLVYRNRKPTCLVTSGDYQRYMEVDGIRYAHIVDPDTGYPAANMRSVTVIHEDSAYCDAMSTALFCTSVEEGQKICEEFDLDAIWIVDKGTVDLVPDLSTDAFDIYITDGLKDQVKLKNQVEPKQAS